MSGGEEIRAISFTPAGGWPVPERRLTWTCSFRRWERSDPAAKRSGWRTCRPWIVFRSNVSAVGSATSSRRNRGFHPGAFQSWPNGSTLAGGMPSLSAICWIGRTVAAWAISQSDLGLVELSLMNFRFRF